MWNRGNLPAFWVGRTGLMVSVRAYSAELSEIPEGRKRLNHLANLKKAKAAWRRRRLAIVGRLLDFNNT